MASFWSDLLLEKLPTIGIDRPGASRVRVAENRKDFLICQITVCISGVTEMEVCWVSGGGCGRRTYLKGLEKGSRLA